MIRDIAALGWKVGVALIFLLPMLYLVEWVTILVRIDPTTFGAQMMLNIMRYVPSILIAMGLGCAVCLLARIESHLRATRGI